MKVDQNIASPQEILKQLEAHDLSLLFNDLVGYAELIMWEGNLVDAEKIVGDVFEKAIIGKRKWNKAHPFKRFLFGAVRSLVDNHNRRVGGSRIYCDRTTNIEELPQNDASDSIRMEYLIETSTKILKGHSTPPDETELMLFESWASGITKPREVAEFWELEIEDVYKAVKRLKRKLGPVKDYLNASANDKR